MRRRAALLALLFALNIGTVSAVSPHAVSLESGWNMISPEATGLQKSDIQDNCGASLQGGPWWYHPSSGRYVASEALNPFRGYWVEMSSSCEFSYSGQAVSETMELSPGWNMISASSETYGISDIEAVCGEGSVEGSIWHWNPASGQYSSADSVQPGKGYWVQMSSSCSFNPETLGSGTPPPTPENQQTDPEPTFELVSVNSARTAAVKVNGELREVEEGGYLWDVSGVEYVKIEEIIQKSSETSSGTLRLRYTWAAASESRTVELSTGTGTSGSSTGSSSMSLENVGATRVNVQAGEVTHLQAKIGSSGDTHQLVRAVWKLGGKKVAEREQTVEAGSTETLQRKVRWHRLDYLGLAGEHQLSATLYRVDEGASEAVATGEGGSITVVESLETLPRFSKGISGTDWVFEQRNVKGGSDDLVQTPSASDSGVFPLVMDTGTTGYCGFAYLKKQFDLSSQRTLTVSFDLDHGSTAGRIGVWVDGRPRSVVNPSDQDRDYSGEWQVELAPGKRDVRIGIKDTGDFCDSSYHRARLEITDIS